MTSFQTVSRRVLFLSTRSTRPSHRFRVASVIPFLEQRGFQCHVDFFPKNPISRFWFYRQIRQFDTVVIQQRTLNPIELKFVRNLAAQLVFDFDDSVMFDAKGKPDRRRSNRFVAIIRAADLVICGNQFLYDRAVEVTGKTAAPRIEIVPTGIDTRRYSPRVSPSKSDRRIVIGWTGSRSTNRYLNSLFPILSAIEKPIELKVISDTTDDLDFRRLGACPYRFVKWSPFSEVAETSAFDIGLMPLPDDNATRGKCACKALQYMALAVPAVCSSVGVIREIVQHDINGFLADSEIAWKETVSRLAADASLRQRVGDAGRKTVESGYSLDKIAAQLADLLEIPTNVMRKRA